MLSAYLTSKQIREKLGNPARTTLARWIDRGEIPAPVKIGHKHLWNAAELEAFIQTQRIQVQAKDGTTT